MCAIHRGWLAYTAATTSKGYDYSRGCDLKNQVERTPISLILWVLPDVRENTAEQDYFLKYLRLRNMYGIHIVSINVRYEKTD